MFTQLRGDVTARFAEVRQLLEVIRKLESVPPTPDPPEAKILRALFFVHLYAGVEFAVSQGVRRLLTEIEKLKVASSHFESPFYSVALDSNFSSLRNVGEDKKWAARSDFLQQQFSSSTGKIRDEVFDLYLQNVWIEKLETIFQCFNIRLPVVPDPSFRLFVDELVDRRNGIAHGRFSALGIGGALRSPELQLRLSAISETCTYVLDCFEKHHLDRAFILTAHRGSY